MVQYLHQLLITLKVVSIQSRHHHWDIDSIDFIVVWLLFFFPISEQESILAPLWILILIRITYAVYYWVYHTTCCESISSARSSLKASRMKTESIAKQRKKKWKCSQVSLAALDTWLLSCVWKWMWPGLYRCICVNAMLWSCFPLRMTILLVHKKGCIFDQSFVSRKLYMRYVYVRGVVMMMECYK